MKKDNWKKEVDDFLIIKKIREEKISRIAKEKFYGDKESAIQFLRESAQKRYLRQKARKIGLAYWPALVYSEGIDSAAFLAAEQVLSRRFGTWNPSAGSHGGWDYYGVHGLCPDTVKKMWFAAGCRDSEKFRLQVATRIVARKADSARFLRDYSRGLRWLKANFWREVGWFSRKAIAALGRLSPELRWAAVHGIELWEVRKVRIRDLNWSRVRETTKLRAEPSARNQALRAIRLPARAAWKFVYGIEQQKGCRHPIDDAKVPDICPAYPMLRLTVAAEIAAGQSPTAICGGTLTRKEAHAFFREGGPSTLDSATTESIKWLVKDLPLEGFVPRNVQVARWLLHVHTSGRWGAILKVNRHPDGRAMRYLDVIDEITPEDLPQGGKTSVGRAFENAAQRRLLVDSDDHTVICQNPFGYLPRWMGLLSTPAALAHEGRVMRHCVGGYTESVRNGECYILSIVTRHGRSTAEIRPGSNWTVSQHRGVSNDEPQHRHQILLAAWVNRLNHARKGVRGKR